MGRKDENIGGRKGFENQAGGLATIEQRHRHVHQNHGRPQFCDHVDRLAPVCRFAHHFKIVLEFENSSILLGHHPVVIHQQYADAFH
jgi:hypothetical protein